jgi:anti-sigma B factor antagonist
VTIWSGGHLTGRVPDVELKVSSQSLGDRVIVTASGEIDLYTVPRLQSELAAVLAGGSAVEVIVDMSGVEFCDSTGMNVLLTAMKRAREHGGGLVLASPRPAVRKILQVTGLDSVFTVVNDATAAARDGAPAC